MGASIWWGGESQHRSGVRIGVGISYGKEDARCDCGGQRLGSVVSYVRGGYSEASSWNGSFHYEGR